MLGITFGSKHTYREWGLILKSYPYISPPKPKTKLIEVPGSNAVIDLTEKLTGSVKYGMRFGHFEFWVMGGRPRWPCVYSAVMNELHGQKLRITMDDDPNYYYLGSVSVNEWQSDRQTATIVLSADVEPYKYKRHGEGRKL